MAKELVKNKDDPNLGCDDQETCKVHVGINKVNDGNDITIDFREFRLLFLSLNR